MVLYDLWKRQLCRHWNGVCEQSWEKSRGALRSAGLEEDALRRMDPDDRVAALEGANLDPYDYIYLAC